MPRRRRHVVEGESPNTRRIRLRSISNNRQEETRRNTVSFQVSTPEDSPASRRAEREEVGDEEGEDVGDEEGKEVGAATGDVTESRYKQNIRSDFWLSFQCPSLFI